MGHVQLRRRELRRPDPVGRDLEAVLEKAIPQLARIASQSAVDR